MNEFKIFSEIDAVSGNEGAARNFIKKICAGKRMSEDSIGNLYVYLDGRKKGKTALVTTHIDEAGMIISSVTENGFLKFKPVGKIDPRVLVSKKVRIGDNRVKGVIGMKAVHLQKKEEREKTAAVKELFIDIGASSKKQALKAVSIGDYAAFDTNAGRLGELFKGKALDRICALCAARAAGISPEYDTVLVFAAQRHIGARGAAAVGIKADIALNLDSVEADDMHGTDKGGQTARLGWGAVTGYGDRLSIADRSFADKLYRAAAEAGIPVQRRGSFFGGGMTGAVQTGFGGRRTACVELPVRYMNTPAALISPGDAEAAERILTLFLENTEGF